MAGRKAASGQGSVYRRKDGRWEAAISLPDGRRRKRVARTQREAYALKDELLHQRDALSVAPARLTVGEFLTGWLDATAAERAPRTQDKYARNVRLYLAPALGRVQLAALAPQQIVALQRDLLARGLAQPTAHDALATLRTALNVAVRWGYLERSPAARVRIVPDVAADVPALPVGEARAILDAFRGHRHEAAIVLPLTLALRQGEVLGLRWQDIELAGRTLHVTGSMKRVPAPVRPAGGPVVARGEPKTALSARSLPLPDITAAALHEHWARAGQRSEWVFAGRDGGPLQARALTVAYDRRLRECGIPHRPYRELRHGCASLLLAAGVPPAVVMVILGHSTTKLTMSVYRRIPAEAVRDAVGAIDRLLG